MKDREFNLLDEAWVRVMRPDCSMEEVSLAEALLGAHDYVDLAGEMPTQDAAVLRVLLALLFAVFSRRDAEGREAPLATPKEAIARWRELWELGRFPERPLRDYFTRWHDRFWLFDDDHPFFQVPDKSWKRIVKNGKVDEVGTAGDTAKLNGELLESANKPRLFKTVAGAESLTYAQATRWLISLMAYDDTAAKPTRDRPEGAKEKYPSPGAGWLGRLGYIQAQGRTLFETLMLNLTLLKDGESAWEWVPCDSEDADKPWCYLPAWELDEPRTGERSPLFLPNHQDGTIIKGDPEHDEESLKRQDRKPCNPMALFTIQSRRVRLSRQNHKVTGYVLLGGDFFDREDAFVEQMTLWRNTNAEKKNAVPCFVPRPHDFSKQFWREFPTAFVSPAAGEERQLPGVVRWIKQLRDLGYLDEEVVVHFAVCAMGYGDKYFFVNDTFSDGLSFHAALLDDSADSAGVRERVVEEIGRCEKAAGAVGWLARNLAAAAGGEADGASARDQFYFRVDRPFRQWLEALDPMGDVDAAIEAWRTTVRGIALKFGDELALAAGPVAFVGRMGKKGYLSTPEALRLFKGTIGKLYPKTKGS